MEICELNTNKILELFIFNILGLFEDVRRCISMREDIKKDIKEILEEGAKKVLNEMKNTEEPKMKED